MKTLIKATIKLCLIPRNWRGGEITDGLQITFGDIRKRQGLPCQIHNSFLRLCPAIYVLLPANHAC